MENKSKLLDCLYS